MFDGGGCATCPVEHCETLTYRGSTCMAQRAKLGLGDPLTNADRIRAMSDEELADAIYELCEKLSDGTLHDISNLYCDGKADCITNAGDVRCNERKERGCVLRWLRQPVKEEST